MTDGSGNSTGSGSTTARTSMLADDFAAISEAARKAVSPADEPSVATSTGPERIFVTGDTRIRTFRFRPGK